MSYKSARERNRRLKKLAEKTAHSYGAGAWYDKEKHRYIRYSCHNKKLKVHCRRATRRRIKSTYNYEYYGKNCKYKRYYDYWWELL